MMNSLMKKLLTMSLAAVLLAVAFSWFFYVPSSQRVPNTYYPGFSETFTIVIIYAGSLYFIAGTPLSILIDKLIRKLNRKSIWKRYLLGLGMYSVAGAIVGVLFIALGGNIDKDDVISLSTLGFIASNLYFHLSLLISKINKDPILN